MRVAVRGSGWVRRLPVVPRGDTVTVTVSTEPLRHVPADDLVSHGYRLVGVHGTGRRDTTAVADVLVPRELQLAHPTWWRQLLDVADRAFDCELGPVRVVLGAELALHLSALRPGGTAA